MKGFVLGKQPESVLRSIKILVPNDGDKGGKAHAVPLDVRVRVLSREEQKEWRKRLAGPVKGVDGEIDPEEQEAFDNLDPMDYVRDIVLDIPKGLIDEEGKAVVFEDHMLEEICAYDYALEPIAELCMNQIYNEKIMKQVRSKN